MTDTPVEGVLASIAWVGGGIFGVIAGEAMKNAIGETYEAEKAQREGYRWKE